MDKNLEWHNETVGMKTVEALIKNNFKAEYAADKETALKKALELIPATASIGLGGSVTNIEIGLEKSLQERGNKMVDWRIPGFSVEQQAATRREALTADVFVTSVNAITLAGEIVNVDGTGNRVAAMTFGPGKVVIIAGMNKIVPDIETALKRIKQISAPLNNKRLNRPNPCTQTGICMNCSAPTRICNVTSILHKRPSLSDITIIVVGEELGY